MMSRVPCLGYHTSTDSGDTALCFLEYLGCHRLRCVISRWVVKNGKGFPYSLSSNWARGDPGVQAVSPQVTWSHPPGGRLPLLLARPAVNFPAEERHRPSAGTKLYCLVTEAHACEQLAQGCYLEADRPRFKPATFRIASERSTVKPHRPHWYCGWSLVIQWTTHFAGSLVVTRSVTVVNF